MRLSLAPCGYDSIRNITFRSALDRASLQMRPMYGPYTQQVQPKNHKLIHGFSPEKRAANHRHGRQIEYSRLGRPFSRDTNYIRRNTLSARSNRAQKYAVALWTGIARANYHRHIGNLGKVPSHEICAAKHRHGRQIEYSRLGRPSSRDKRQAHRAPRKARGLYALSHGRPPGRRIYTWLIS